MRDRAISMTTLRRPDYIPVLGAATILIAIGVIGGIVYTYTNRPIALNGHRFDHPRVLLPTAPDRPLATPAYATFGTRGFAPSNPGEVFPCPCHPGRRVGGWRPGGPLNFGEPWSLGRDPRLVSIAHSTLAPPPPCESWGVQRLAFRFKRKSPGWRVA